MELEYGRKRRLDKREIVEKETCYGSAILRKNLNHFDKYLQDKDVVEILANKEGEIITETQKGFHYHKTEIKKEGIEQIATIIAYENGLDFDSTYPTLSADCKYEINGQIENIRISSVCGKFTENGVCLSIRKKNPFVFPIQAFFNSKKSNNIEKKQIELENLPIEKKLKIIFENNESLIICGGTSTGKTSCLNTIIKYLIPQNKRIITIEDTREITCENPNALQIINRDSTNIDKYLQLLNITIRLRPDWLIIGEIRNKMASTFLNFASSGHPAITTLHASSPVGAIQRLSDLIQLGGSSANKKDIENYIVSNIRYIIQLQRGKKRKITSEIYEIFIENSKLTIKLIK